MWPSCLPRESNFYIFIPLNKETFVSLALLHLDGTTTLGSLQKCLINTKHGLMMMMDKHRSLLQPPLAHSCVLLLFMSTTTLKLIPHNELSLATLVDYQCKNCDERSCPCPLRNLTKINTNNIK